MIEIVSSELDLPLSSHYGEFSFGAVETVNSETGIKAEHFLVYLNLTKRPLNLRINSACFTGDLFGDSRCDCHWQMIEFMRIMKETGQGLLIYHLHHEGRANGVIAKLKSYKASDSGHFGRDAYESIGLKAESREYNSSAVILNFLGIDLVKLYSNNPQKLLSLRDHGVHIEDHVQIRSTRPELEKFYKWKRDHFGHIV